MRFSRTSDMLDPLLHAGNGPSVCKRCGAPCEAPIIGGRMMPVVCGPCAGTIDALNTDDEARRRYAAAGLYGRSLEQCFESYQAVTPAQQRVFEAAAALAEAAHPGTWLVMIGPPGTGKDHLATAIVRRMVDRGLKCFAESAFGLMAKYREMAYGDGREATGETAALKWFQVLDLLVIRDLGTKQLTNAECATVIDLLDRRYNARGDVVLTTNLDCKQLSELLTPRVTDRFAEMCAGGKALLCDWPSYRREHK